MFNASLSARRFPCDCPLCGCPGAGGRGGYTFRYVRPPLVYYDVPKAASSSIRRALFGPDESMSCVSPGLFSRGMIRFSFVRNPFARAVSNWKMFTNQPARKDQIVSMGGSPDFGFLAFLEFARSHPNHHWLPQSPYVPKRLDFLGRLERFDADFEVVQSKALDAGLIEEIAPPLHLNKTGGLAYPEYYGDAERDLVAAMYKVDIERFDYRF